MLSRERCRIEKITKAAPGHGAALLSNQLDCMTVTKRALGPAPIGAKISHFTLDRWASTLTGGMSPRRGLSGGGLQNGRDSCGMTEQLLGFTRFFPYLSA